MDNSSTIRLHRVPRTKSKIAHVDSEHGIVENKTRNREVLMSPGSALPRVAGYRFDKAANLADQGEREKLSPAAIKAFNNIAKKWGLNEEQSRGLLGGIASSTFHSWRTSPEKVKLHQDTLMRISLLIGIYKSLNIYFGKPWSDRWIVLGNRGPLFNGQAPIDYMLMHGQPGMVQVRSVLDSWRGGR